MFGILPLEHEQPIATALEGFAEATQAALVALRAIVINSNCRISTPCNPKPVSGVNGGVAGNAIELDIDMVAEPCCTPAVLAGLERTPQLSVA